MIPVHAVSATTSVATRILTSTELNTERFQSVGGKDGAINTSVLRQSAGEAVVYEDVGRTWKTDTRGNDRDEYDLLGLNAPESDRRRRWSPARHAAGRLFRGCARFCGRMTRGRGL